MSKGYKPFSRNTRDDDDDGERGLYSVSVHEAYTTFLITYAAIKSGAQNSVQFDGTVALEEAAAMAVAAAVAMDSLPLLTLAAFHDQICNLFGQKKETNDE